MKRLFRVMSFISYLIRSRNEHGVHSPFVFELLTQVIYHDKEYYSYQKVNALREELLNSDKRISCPPLGAGSRKNASSSRTVGDLIRHSAKSPKYCRLLFRLVNHFRPSEILELGTSLGMSTCYLALPDSRAVVTTIEGCPEAALQAKEGFQKLGLRNIRQRTGTFEAMLPQALQEMNAADFVFFDGNHQKEATLDYFRQCLQKANDRSVFIFDDIYWSPGMKQAWEEIKRTEQVKVSIDLFQLGIVFFRKEQEKQHFVIRY